MFDLEVSAAAREQPPAGCLEPTAGDKLRQRRAARAEGRRAQGCAGRGYGLAARTIRRHGTNSTINSRKRTHETGAGSGHRGGKSKRRKLLVAGAHGRDGSILVANVKPAIKGGQTHCCPTKSDGTMATNPEPPDLPAQRIDSSESSRANDTGRNGLRQGDRYRIAERPSNAGLRR